MNRRAASTSARDAALITLFVAVCAALLAIAGVLVLGATLTRVLTGGSWMLPGVEAWPPAAARIIAEPGHPGTALGGPFADALTGHTGLYWTITGLLLTITITAAVLGGRPLWRRIAPTPPGYASRADIRAELSPAAARRTAQWTRPSLTATQIRRAPLEQISAPLHLSPHGIPMCTPLENPTGSLAPTQSGKSRTSLVHLAHGAPAALLCSSTKPDILEFTALARSRRPGGGPVLVCDATGAVGWPAQLQWSFLQGCEDPGVAYRRSHTMVEASAVGLHGVGGNDKVFRDRAKIVLQGYFLAAAIAHRDVGDLVAWAMTKPADLTPVKLLQAAGHTEFARDLRSEIGMVAETSDAVWMSVRRVLEPLLNPQLRWLCTPRPGAEFNVREFIAAHGSLYIVAGQHQAAQAAPILTALVEHWLTTAQEMALHTPARRLDPPATAILDELTGATPVPQLPEVIADSAGRGVLIHWATQSIAQLEDAYTPQRSRQILDNTTTLSVWGGIKDLRTLEWVSTMTGHHDRLRYQDQTDGMFGTGRTSAGQETVPTYRAGDVRRIPRGRVLVIHRHVNPVLARTVDVKKRNDWATIRRDVAVVRDGAIPIDPAGYPTTEPAVTAAPPPIRRP